MGAPTTRAPGLDGAEVRTNPPEDAAFFRANGRVAVAAGRGVAARAPVVARGAHRAHDAAENVAEQKTHVCPKCSDARGRILGRNGASRLVLDDDVVIIKGGRV